MSRRGTLILIVLALTTLVWLIFFEPTSRPILGAPLLHFDPSKITTISITDGDDVLTLRRRDDFWELSTLPPDRADSREVNFLLSAAQDLQALDVLSPGEIHGPLSLSTLGLKTSKRSLTLEDDSKKKQTLFFGNEAVGEKRLYARLGKKGDVIIIPSLLSELSLRPVDQFRDHRLTPLETQRLEKVTLRRGNASLELAEHGREWQMVRPVIARVDSTTLEKWLTPLLGTGNSIWVAQDAGDLSPYGLDQPRGEISLLEEGTKTPEVLSLGGSVPSENPGGKQAAAVYLRSAKRHGIFQVPAALEEIFMMTPDRLRDHQLLHLDLDTIDRLVISHEGQNLTLQRQSGGGGDWVTERDHPATIAGGSVEKLVNALQDARVSSFLPATPANLQTSGLEPPVTSLRFIAHLSENSAEESAGEHLVAQISFGRPTGDMVLARVVAPLGSGSPGSLDLGDAAELCQIPSSTLDLVSTDLAAWTAIATPSSTPMSSPSPVASEMPRK